MKKTTESALMFLIAIVFAIPTYAQYKDNTVFLYYPFYDNGKNKWGYCDSTSHVLIKPKYDEVDGFYQGFALAKDGLWGLISEKGAWVIKPQYSSALLGDEGHLSLSNETGDPERMLIVDGRLLKNQSYNEGTVESNDAELIWHEPTQKILRYYDDNLNRWALGNFHHRDNKKDSLSKSVSFTFAFFSEPRVEKNWRFSWYKSDAGKSGLLAWQGDQLDYRILEATYDSIWIPKKFYASDDEVFFARNNDKISIIRFALEKQSFSESPEQFDEIKEWGRESVVARIANEWFLVPPSLSKQFIVKDVDDILHPDNPFDFGVYYYYKKDGLLGVLVSTRPKSWSQIPAKFKSIECEASFFNQPENGNERLLFYVTLPNGNKGPITSRGTLLFK